ncbi:MAG: M28 family peptidase [candidate division Zixibacteria bacterium]|nr:M28 family peptidase [candidate division Zixibacteria bacterium]
MRRAPLLFFLPFLLFGCAPAEPPVFSGARAYEILKEYCALGPRVPGSEAHRQAASFIAARLEKLPLRVKLQPFTYYDSLKRDSVRFVNIIAAFQPERKKRILLCTHWESRPYADGEKDSALHRQPILGANDGGSGVAILLALAELLGEKDSKIGVDLVFFDGEDYGPEGVLSQYLIGSKYFAKNAGSYWAEYGILLDMVGDSDLTIYQEQYSTLFAGKIVQKVFARARKLGLSAFVPEIRHAVMDDHLSLLDVGLPVIDLIDFDYPFWHTLADRPEACSPKSLEQVGRLLVSLLYEPE